MVHLIVQISKYLMILLFLIYTYLCFHIFRFSDRPKKQKRIYEKQRVYMLLIHFDGFLVLYVTTLDLKIAAFYVAQLILFEGIYLIYHLFYKKASELVLNNMIMLLSIGMIILTRISLAKAIRQFIFLTAGSVLALLIPVILQKMSVFRRLTWVYAGIGILALLAVCVMGSYSYGAKLSISFGGISIQPSEFVKILFVFFTACMFYRDTEFKTIIETTVMAAAYVLVLVLSKDLGSALIFFLTYLTMLFVATGSYLYLFSGLLCGSGASVVAYWLFAHVRTRVAAWKNPWADIDNRGYQITQSLFAIGTGGWFGMGLYQGMPYKIPVVEKDFVFAAISEELGGIFALCMLLICLGCFLQFVLLAARMQALFYKLIAFGLAMVYAVQVFLTVGGVTKFIPSTGVTLPLVSYGGSSVLSTFIIFGVIQGLYILKQNDEEDYEKDID